jgi:PKD repeat protein
MKNLYLTFSFLGLMLLAQFLQAQCTLNAEFTYSINGNTVTFTNTSTNLMSSMTYSWDFFDGGTSNQENPVHTFASPGSYHVCLITLGYDSLLGSCFDSACHTINITSMGCNISADFSYTTSGTNAHFNNTSSNYPYSTNWSWSFGDGDFSSLENPTHIYGSQNSYYVCLTAWYNDSITGLCADTTCYWVDVFDSTANPCNISADYTYTTNGTYVFFTNTSTNYPYSTNWEWHFGDGQHTYAMQPSHHYASPGTYNVCLYASYVDSLNGYCSDTACYTITVLDSTPAPCNIIADYTYTTNGNTVYFTNTSSNYPYSTNWEWHFGDGNYTFDMNPTHTYASQGTYEVCLYASYYDSLSGHCVDTMCKYITVPDSSGGPCNIVSDFTYITNGTTAYFTNTSSNYPYSTSWSWNFGDGNYSSDMNPIHTYTAQNSYLVCLTAWYNDSVNGLCVDTMCYWVDVFDSTGNPCNIHADYSYTVNGYTVNFTNTSSNYPPTVQWEWSFDDGGHAYTMDANHTYTTQGNYEVCLFASYWDSINGHCIDTMCQFISVPDSASGIAINHINEIKLYPNPTNGIVILEMGEIHGETQIRIINMLGQIELELSTTDPKLMMDLSELEKGMYIIMVYEEEGVRRSATLLRH